MLKCHRILLIKFAVIIITWNWKISWLANLQTKSVDVTVFPGVRIDYCPFFPLHAR